MQNSKIWFLFTCSLNTRLFTPPERSSSCGGWKPVPVQRVRAATLKASSSLSAARVAHT